ncbi:MAG TPA: leucyl aminopeptidase, partial [Zetaproteobacteria bacterium]|nr:leucyl aminopeptidase [Zetaproteobacteria bacterium]
MIEITVKAGAAAKQRDDAVVLPLLEGRKLTASGSDLQRATGKKVSAFLRKFDVSGA